MATIAELKSYFETGKYPTEEQFAELIDTFGDVVTVVNNIGTKLFHNATVAYPANSVVMTLAGIWYSIDPVAAGVFNPDDWQLLFSFTAEPNVSALGIPGYDPNKNDYVLGNQVNWENKIYEAVDAGPFGGIEPGTDPDWESYWALVLYTEGGVIPVVPDGGFVKDQSVYEYTGTAAAKGLYRANYIAPGFDGGFKTTNFANELAASKWLLVAIKEAEASEPIVKTFDVTITDPSAIRGCGSTPIELVVASSGKKIQALTAFVEISGGSADYDFIDMTAITDSLATPCMGTVQFDYSAVTIGPITALNSVSTNAFCPLPDFRFIGDGLYLSQSTNDATTGDRQVRVWGTYAEFQE